MDILSLDATDQLQALASRQISARELLQACLAQTNRLDGRLNAVVARDQERAFAIAQQIDERRVHGGPLGALAGLPMTVKDALDVEGLPASAGIRKLLNRTATDAVVVSRVRAVDAIVWGKTNTPVKAADWQTINPVYGRTNNPWDVRRTPGGSSGGSAAALAAGMTALEIGADIGGSLRIPAGFCGVFAHKPTYGVVPQRGLVPPPDSDVALDLAVVGPMARSARDLRLLLSIIGDGAMPAVAPPIGLKGLKVALWLDAPGFALEPEIKGMLASLGQMLAAGGAIVEPVTSPVDVTQMMFAYITLLFSVISGDLTSTQRAAYNLARGPAKLTLARKPNPLSWAQFIVGFTARRSEWLQADQVRTQLCEKMKAFFSRYDVLLTPISPTVAFAHDTRLLLQRRLRFADGSDIGYFQMWQWIALATLCGLPATAMPVGLDRQGLPVGLQIIGPHGGDARTLGVAQAIEEHIGGFRSPPLLDTGS